MSRCKACDVILDEWELSASDADGRYYDMCKQCLRAVKSSLDALEEESATIFYDLDLYYLD